MAHEAGNGYSESMLLIFGLSPVTTAQEVKDLIGRGQETRVQMLSEPGHQEEIVALVHLPPDRAMAGKLASRVSQMRLHDRSLQAWVPVLAWG